MKGLRKKKQNYLRHSKDVYAHKRAKDDKKKTSNNWYKKQEKKLRARGSEYPNTKIWRKKLQQKMLAVSRI